MTSASLKTLLLGRPFAVTMDTVAVLQRTLGSALAAVAPEHTRQVFVERQCERDHMMLVQALGPRLNRSPDLDSMAFDLEPNGRIGFEYLAGLFSETSLNHAVIAMSIRQTAYLYGLIQDMDARKVIEVGRYKGGSTIVIAAAMAKRGELWSIDIGEKESRLFGTPHGRSFDDQTAAMLERLHLSAHLIVGDSRTIEVETGEVDLVFIDGDHSYEGVRSDLARFGTRARIGGVVLLDDAYDEGAATTYADSVGRAITEFLDRRDDFFFEKRVGRMAQLSRAEPKPR